MDFTYYLCTGWNLWTLSDQFPISTVTIPQQKPDKFIQKTVCQSLIDKQSFFLHIIAPDRISA